MALFLISLGAGGIKATVAPFGGDQFKPGQEEMLASFFAIFYFMINLGAMLSTVITPLIRVIPCMGEDSCYPAAFGLPAGLMVLTIGVFVAFTKQYTRVPMTENPVMETTKCIAVAIRNMWRARDNKKETHDHWMRHRMATHVCEDDGRCTKMNCHMDSLVTDTIAFLRLMVMFITITFYWTLYSEAGQIWLIQSLSMTTKIAEGFHWLPDQMAFFNTMLILVLIPLFTAIVYPLVRKCGINTTPLRKMCTGGLIIPFGLYASAILQQYVALDLAVQPASNAANIYFINNFPCNVSVQSAGPALSASTHSETLLPFSVTPGIPSGRALCVRVDWHQTLLVPGAPTTVVGNGSLQSSWSYRGACTGGAHSAVVPVSLGRSFSASLSPDGVHTDAVKLHKSVEGEIHFTIALSYATTHGLLMESSDAFLWCPAASPAACTKADLKTARQLYQLRPSFGRTSKWIDLPSGSWDLFYTTQNGSELTYSGVNVTNNGEGSVLLLSLFGGPTRADPSIPINGTVLQIAPDSRMCIFWQIPQYFILTVSEILFSITGYELAYSQAPVSMKSVVQAFWLLTMAIGSFIFMGLEAWNPMPDPTTNMLVMGSIYYIVIGIFVAKAYFWFTYKDYLQSAGTQMAVENDGEKS